MPNQVTMRNDLKEVEINQLWEWFQRHISEKSTIVVVKITGDLQDGSVYLLQPSKIISPKAQLRLALNSIVDTMKEMPR